MKIVIVFTEKEQIFFYLIVYMPMRTSDVITNVTKQNMNVRAYTFSVSREVLERQKQKSSCK